MAKEKKLTLRQEKFCLEYFTGITAIEAMRRAGYSEGTLRANSDKLTGNPLVQQRLAELKAAHEEKCVATRQERLMFLTAVMRGEITEEVLLNVNQGDYSEVQRHEKKPSVKDRIQACKEITALVGDSGQAVIGFAPVIIKEDLND